MTETGTGKMSLSTCSAIAVSHWIVFFSGEKPGSTQVSEIAFSDADMHALTNE